LIQSKTLELLEWPRLCQHLSTFAATKLGAVAARHLKIPACLEESLDLLQQTQEVYELENMLLSQLNFDGIHDISMALERAELQGILSGEELLQAAMTLAGARNLRRMIDRQPGLSTLNQLVTDLRTYPEVEQEIRRCIDERGQVADRASAELAEIRDRQRQLRDQIYQVLQNILQRRSNAVQEHLITQRGDRFVIPIKAAQKDAVPGIVHDTSTSGATLYVEPHATVNLNNQLRQLLRQEQTEAERIRRALTEQVASIKTDLSQLLVVVTILDLATARSRYSTWLEGNRPRFVDREAGETVRLRQLRHPLLIWQQQHEHGEPVVPIDLVIQPQIRVVAITGPNTGGKTVTLKTLGLAALMAKVGLFVPAREPVELPWFDQILVDIGDEQSLQQSLSTFSSHIQRIREILDNLSHQSLVLLDEVGAGTDPSEGSALAIALLQYLADHAQLTIATTHFGELKALKYQDQRFENASVEFDDDTLSPTYRLLWGIPGRSNALIIARRLGLKPEVINRAETQVDAAADDVNQVIAGLEAQRRYQETKAHEAAQLLENTERLHREVAQKATSIQTRERELRQQQEQAVQEAINTAKREIAGVIRQLQQGPTTAQEAQHATQSLERIAERHLPSRHKAAMASPKPGFQPQVGDRVQIPSLGQIAEVITAPNQDGDLTVRFGLMKMSVNLREISSLSGEKAELATKSKASTPQPAATPSTSAPAVRTSQNTLDLRGSRVADAEIALDRAIANANGPLWIIHGHGTGKLRQGVQAYLKQHPRVEHYEFAEQSDGGTGVTIAHIRA
jgi:DNA mismatch repair protein MutS2